MFGHGIRRQILLGPDELSGLRRCGVLAATPLRPGPFSMEITSIGLGDVMLQFGRSAPVAILGTLDDRAAWLVLPEGVPRGLIMNGREFGPDTIGAYGAGAEHEVASHANGAWAIVMLPAGSARALVFPPAGSPILRPGAAALLRAPQAARERIAALLRRVRGVVARNPAVFELEGPRLALRGALLDAVHALLSGSAPGENPVRLRGGSPARRKVVRRADTHFRSDPAGASYAAGLSAAVGVPPSLLQAAFAAVLGVTPEHYVQLLRLALVRAALRSRPTRWDSVDAAAVAHGFQQQDRFSQAYLTMFGEAPAATLGRAPP